jgi:hypothetical protein
MLHEPRWFAGLSVLAYFGLTLAFPLALSMAAQVDERPAMTSHEFEIAFPKVMGWIDQTLSAHAQTARPVASMHFRRLPLYFSQAQIEAAKFVVIDRLPLPLLSSIGLSRFKEFERDDYGGVTFLDTYFLTRASADNE